MYFPQSAPLRDSCLFLGRESNYPQFETTAELDALLDRTFHCELGRKVSGNESAEKLLEATSPPLRL